MCGIWGYVELKKHHELIALFKAFMNIQPRGPDRSDFKQINEFVKIYLGFHRLAIMDRSTYGDQPFTLEIKNEKEHRSIYVICNGEIYNFQKLIEENKLVMRSGSDCEPLPHLYAKFGFRKMIEQLRGEFAICCIDIDHLTDRIQIYIGRDPTGIRPVFIGIDENGIGFSSTLRGLCQIVHRESREVQHIRQIKCGEIVSVSLVKDCPPQIKSESYFSLDVPRMSLDVPFEQILKQVREKFIESISIRLHSDRPIGALLSGGLDSSLIVAVAARYFRQSGKKLKTFSIGIDGVGTDKPYALMVSNHCGTIHTHVDFSEEEFLAAIPTVIETIESYDITTVRASVGQYLICKWIRENSDIRVLLCGDYSDEYSGGYRYVQNAPSAIEMHKDCIRLGENIIYFDELRADRSIASNGLEGRMPFGDHEYAQLYLSIDPELRMPIHDPSLANRDLDEKSKTRRIEKWLLRKAFDCDAVIDQTKTVSDDYPMKWLPDAILYRAKEAFSDGVSAKEKSWYQMIQEDVENLYTDSDFDGEEASFHMKPPTKEALHYRLIFNKIFGYETADCIPYWWFPQWSGDTVEPSARVLVAYDT